MSHVTLPQLPDVSRAGTDKNIVIFILYRRLDTKGAAVMTYSSAVLGLRQYGLTVASWSPEFINIQFI
jgi:hypothetical protein